MPHFHTLPNGTATSSEILDPADPGLHWHTIGDDPTSKDAFGTEHTHTFEGAVTSGPKDQSDKGISMKRETKQIGGNVLEVKQEDRNGVKVGIISGYIATWDVDRGSWGLKDRFTRGAFAESISDHQVKGRQVRLKDHHGRTVGGFPASTLREDEKGLFGVGEINLEVQQGLEAYLLAKQGVLEDFSIGFSSLVDSEANVDGERIRTISKAIIWEGSIVDEPMNPAAKITEVKSAFQEMPLASHDTAWDPESAIERVKSFTAQSDDPTPLYSKAFFQFDGEDTKDFDAYSLLIADVVDNQLVAVPQAIYAAATSMKNAQKSKLGPDDVKDMSERDVEKALRSSGAFTKSAAKMLAGRLDGEQKQVDNIDQQELGNLLQEIKSLADAVKQ